MLQPFKLGCLLSHDVWMVGEQKKKFSSSCDNKTKKKRERERESPNIEFSALFDVKIKLQQWKFNKLPSTRHTEALLKKKFCPVSCDV
jgi:hypothetical protein